LNADPPTSDLHHFESVSSTYHRVLRDSQQSATFTEGITQRTIHVFWRVEIGLLTVIAIRGRAVKGHSLAIVR
jgi:hypothetical protein